MVGKCVRVFTRKYNNGFYERVEYGLEILSAFRMFCFQMFEPDRLNYERHFVDLPIKWASTPENLSSGCANNKGADQPAHPHSLISAFVIRFLESIIHKFTTS